MVTQRWWGNKFCKRTCKNAYLRENGGARLAAALAVAVLMLLLLASANAVRSPPAAAGTQGEQWQQLRPSTCTGQAVREQISDARLRRNSKAAHLRRFP
jgi:hypothetical protein